MDTILDGRVGERSARRTPATPEPLPPCTACLKLSLAGQCAAAWHGAIGKRRKLFHVPELPRRCEGYAPVLADPNRRVGHERRPGLEV